MSEIKIFENPEFGSVRTQLTEKGEPLFCLKDVCKILDIKNHNEIVAKLDDGVVSIYPIVDILGREQNATFINEDGLYDVILDSRKPEAKAFRKWVTGTVLPSIRKNGGYIANQEEIDPYELMSKALVVAHKVLADREARLEAQKQQIAELKPKGEYFDTLVERELNVNFRDAAKELGCAPKKFVAWLMNNKYIYRDLKGELKPYAQHIENELFAINEYVCGHNNRAGLQTLITPKGRVTFSKLLQLCSI